MTEDQIIADRQQRVADCKKELEDVLGKYTLALTAEDNIGAHTKISIELLFRDLKQYPTAVVAQPVAPIVPTESDIKDMISGPGDVISPLQKQDL